RWAPGGGRRWIWGVAGCWKWTSGSSSTCHLDALLKTHGVDDALLELTQHAQRFRLGREQVQLGGRIACDRNGSLVNAIVQPVLLDFQSHGHLRHGPLPPD